MSVRFAALGFDPAPGDPEAVAGAARRLGRVAEELGQQAGALERSTAVTSSWEGSAACAYAGQVAARATQLRAAAEVLGAVSDRLLWWSGELRDLQEMALRLERAAVPASTAVCLPGPPTELEALRSRAQRLLERAEHSATFVAADVRRAVEACPATRRFDGWTDAPFGIPVGPWVAEHDDELDVVADVATGAGVVLGVGSAVVGAPVTVSVLGLGAAAGGVAAIAHSATAHYGEGSWGAVALDVVGMGAAGAAIKGVRSGSPLLTKVGGRVGHVLNANSTQDISRRRLGGPAEAAPSARTTTAVPTLRQPHTPETRRVDATLRAAAGGELDALLVAPVRGRD